MQGSAPLDRNWIFNLNDLAIDTLRFESRHQKIKKA